MNICKTFTFVGRMSVSVFIYFQLAGKLALKLFNKCRNCHAAIDFQFCHVNIFNNYLMFKEV